MSSMNLHLCPPGQNCYNAREEACPEAKMPADTLEAMSSAVPTPPGGCCCTWLFHLISPGFVTTRNFVADGGMTRKMIYTE